uniref:ribosomal protein S3 n=1 Tax=Chlamydomonas chlamydogama TaxID=225041 RepID=UPI00226D26B9|nr:ribosomal protein S3 [Chlamydomonas chlamydogama]UZA61969.1 ribosomal protein S3 [Chlamydomonas chlamydogama]
MGQKVHPLGFRVGITKKHQSQWFARFNKHKYSQSILEDRMIRETLSKLFPELLNPVLKKVQKREDDVTITPRITQIKIERGLIPYEIGIQIHAENCDLLKSAIDNLKVKRELVSKLQKTRRYLLNLKLKMNDLTNASEKELTSTTNSERLENKTTGKKSFKFKSKLTKQQLKRQRLIKKRLRKRELIRRRYRQLIAKGLFIKKTGNKIIQKLSLKSKKLVKKSNNSKGLSVKKVTFTNKNKEITSNTFGARIKRKFVTVFIQKMNKKFLKHLKESIRNWHQISQKHSANGSLPLGFSKKWSLNRLNSLKNESLSKLTRMVIVLEQKSLVKLESLRKEFIAFGSISKIQSFGYYQIVNFLKNLKDLVNRLKREQKLLAFNKSKQIILNQQNSNFSGLDTTKQPLTESVLRKKLNNVEDECRKIKFIEYLKEIVKTHRTNNIYFYLSTLAEARKDLRKIKQFTKRHSDFLFGLNLNTLEETKNQPNDNALEQKITDRVSKVLEKTTKKHDLEKNLQDIFLEQIEKQRNMCLDNLALTPKISIKFYSVNSKSLESKASVVADSVVDALEKRKAFRKVIKDAKETLMRTSGVKGVKIQVSGRLNGAEIARTEWVRAGRLPLQTLRANLDYSYRTASTIYGIIGVKVWIFKGYTKLITK